MNLKYSLLMFVIALAVLFCGCNAVQNADMVPVEDLQEESSVVFTRAAKYHPYFGTYSIREFVEITYCKAHYNDAGQMVVEVGIRNRGPASWKNWWHDAPAQISLKSKCNFFRGDRVASPIVYSTNNRNIVIKRGETYAYRAVCPRGEAKSFQLVLGGYNE